MGSVEEDLAAYEPWLLKNVQRFSNPENLDEMIQEGRIAMWLARKDWDSSSGIKVQTHMMNKTQWHWRQLNRSGRLTGMESRQGRPDIAHYERHENSYDWQADDSELAYEYKSPFDDLAFHYEEIQEAVIDLPEHQKKIVLMKFWLQLGEREMASINNSSRAAIWQCWDRARKNLAAELSHLKGAY